MVKEFADAAFALEKAGDISSSGESIWLPHYQIAR